MSRFPLICVAVSSCFVATGFYGCDSPEAFHISGDGSLLIEGSGGTGPGGEAGTSTGGTGPGTGGIIATGGSGTGGITATGGVGVGGQPAGGAGGHGSGGAVGGHPTGGAGGTAGQGSGGAGAGGGGGKGMAGNGGRAMGGSSGAGGRTTGTGGAGGGAGKAGAGGMTATGGAGGMGGVVGTRPCSGLCSPATVFAFMTAPASYGSPNLGTTAACYEVSTTQTIQGGGCSNCTIDNPPRTVKINGVSLGSGTWAAPLPAKVRGGYCIQVTQGATAYASFFTF